MPASHFLGPLLSAAPSRLGVWVAGRRRPLATTVEGALDSAARKKGLLGRDSLAQDTALVIAPCSAIHTFGMRFSIDVIFAARDGRVLKIRHAMPARRVAAALGAFAVLEMAAGEVDRCGLRVGDLLEVRPAPELSNE
jgi:uncharacterized membrane protein (UPF0127 family)